MRILFTNLLLLILLSTPVHAQWYGQSSGVSTNLYSFFSIDGTTAWATGANGVILKTTNKGASWVIKPSGTSYTISFVHFFNPDEGIIAGSGGTIKKTYNGGDTWQSVYGGTYNRLQEGCFVDDSTGYMCGDAGIIIKTTDRGNTWTPTVITPNNICFIDFVNENTGFISTENSGQIWKTTNGGLTWSLKQTVGDISIWQIHFVDESHGWFVGEFGMIGKTTDGGETWFQQFSGVYDVNLRSVYFFTTDIGWVVGKDETRLSTTNGGTTWTLEHTGYDYEYLYIYFYNESIGWIIGTPGWWTGNSAVMLYTENGGIPVELINFKARRVESEIILEWTTATETNNSGFEIERKKESDDWEKIGFVPGHGTTSEMQNYNFSDKPDQSGIYTYRLKQINYDGSFEYSDEINIEFVALIEFSLEQNYPNPFNPITTIRYSIAEREFVTLQIFNSLGEMVIKLINEEKEAGVYESTFNASNLPSGVYFYCLKAGDFTQTKKLLLLK